MQEVVIAGAARTAIGKFGGSLSGIPVTELGTTVVKEAMRKAGVAPEEVHELIMGHVLQAGVGLNSAHQVSRKSGMPISVSSYTVNKVCASGMKAVALGALAIASGENKVVIAGGMENMSAAPFLLTKARWGYRLGNGEINDYILSDALTDPLENCHMGITAENLAKEFDITRRMQDEFSFQSQQKAAEAQKNGKFDEEIVTVEVPVRKGDTLLFNKDEFIRTDTSIEALSCLKTVFDKHGTVTAGNASGINDGAAAMVLMSADEAKKREIKPMAKIISYASAGVEPGRMGIGPVDASKKAMDKAGLKISDIDVIELNEAFAAQSLAVIGQLGIDCEKVNLNGGAIAIGHPVGASGARIIVTLLHIMEEKKSRLGLATLCIGGGQGMALIVERC